jgi:hypothetical protein
VADVPRHRRGWVAFVLTLAVITGVIAVVSTWANRQALDTNNWTNTSSKLLADKSIQNALGAYLVNEIFANVDVSGQLRNALPKQAQALAGPASAGLRDLATQAVPQLLARPRIQQAWRNANRAAHKQFLAILNGGGSAVSTQNGEVVLNLHTLVTELASSLGISAPSASQSAQARNTAQQKLGVTIPNNAGRLVVMRSQQLNTAQNIAKAIRHLSIISSVVSLCLFALAIFLASGWRRIALRSSGWCFVGVGVGVLLVRRIGGSQVVDQLVKNESIKHPAHDAWNIGTGLLRAIAIALVIYGLLLVLAAWLAGPSGSAVAIRRALAPTLRDHPARVYGTAAFVYLLVLLWGPTPAFRHWIPVLLIAALLVLGIELLRHQAAREFPDAHAGDAAARMRGWLATRRGRTASDGQQPVAGGRG